MNERPRKRSRSRSRSPPPWQRDHKSPRRDYESRPSRSYNGQGRGRGRGRGDFMNHHQRRNQEQEDRHMRAWMSQEDDFVLKQSKKKAKIRIKEGRAKPIDRLVLLLSIVDPAKDLLEDDLDDADVEIKEPSRLIDESSLPELQDLEREIEHYLVLEHNESNITFWQALQTVCKYRLHTMGESNSRRGIVSVSAEVDKLLGPKTLEQLRSLEGQVHQKLRSDEAIDEEYWEQLLESIVLYKAKAHLKHFYAIVQKARLAEFQRHEVAHARQLSTSLNRSAPQGTDDNGSVTRTDMPEPLPALKLRPEDQSLEIVDEMEFETKIAQARARVAQLGYIQVSSTKSTTSIALQNSRASQRGPLMSGNHSAVTDAMYNREVANGMEEDEEVFAGEEEVMVTPETLMPTKFQPRKPKHFNRVQMGYEWNKYNQTHYDHDNPPPKVVQGYKFNIFYPDLIDTSKAPTYRITREDGRKKGQSLAPAGQEDTCLIRFVSGPPYEDIAFRIVDREWDYSAKRERGFKSSFEKGVLQLHFQFKKIHYRK